MIKSMGGPWKRFYFLFSIPWSGCLVFLEEAAWPWLSRKPFNVRAIWVPLAWAYRGLSWGTVSLYNVGEKEVCTMALCLSSNGQIKHTDIVLCFLGDIYVQFFSRLVFIFWLGLWGGEWTQVVSNGWVPLFLLVTPPWAWNPATTPWAHIVPGGVKPPCLGSPTICKNFLSWH